MEDLIAFQRRPSINKNEKRGETGSNNYRFRQTTKNYVEKGRQQRPKAERYSPTVGLYIPRMKPTT